MTPEQWQQVEKALSGTYGYAKLKVDGREVVFSRGMVDKNRLGIITYVDGRWEAKWISSKTEYPEQRFLRPHEKYIYPQKRRDEFKKLPARVRKELVKSVLRFAIDEKRKWFSPIWHNTVQIRRHYQKTFTSIELVEVVG